LDIFWLKDESLEDNAKICPRRTIIAAEIAKKLETALNSSIA
jgi:hypothetical protein